MELITSSCRLCFKSSLQLETGISKNGKKGNTDLWIPFSSTVFSCTLASDLCTVLLTWLMMNALDWSSVFSACIVLQLLGALFL